MIRIQRTQYDVLVKHYRLPYREICSSRAPGLLGQSLVSFGLTSGMNHIAIEALSSFARNAHLLNDVEAQIAIESCADLLAGSLLLGFVKSGVPFTARANLSRVKLFIEMNLADPKLGTAMIAAATKLSPRTVVSLFELDGSSVMKFVWHRRLERARMDLIKPQLSTLTIAEIAFRCGFRDPAHFSRRFNSEYSHSPSDWRRANMMSLGRKLNTK